MQQNVRSCDTKHLFYARYLNFWGGAQIPLLLGRGISTSISSPLPRGASVLAPSTLNLSPPTFTLSTVLPQDPPWIELTVFVLADRTARSIRAGKWLREKPRFLGPKNLKSQKFRFFRLFSFLMKFCTCHIYFHILIDICEFCYNL